MCETLVNLVIEAAEAKKYEDDGKTLVIMDALARNGVKLTVCPTEDGWNGICRDQHTFYFSTYHPSCYKVAGLALEGYLAMVNA